jgi:hypothetical protein
MKQFILAIGLLGLLGATMVQASGETGTCASHAQAIGQPYGGGVTGTGGGDLLANGYTAADCVGLAQTHAIYQAGNACEQAGTPPGFGPGSGYAVVDWLLSWFGDDGGFLSFGPIEQQYDCGDTFAS